jgi:uncharacterized protein (DUF885 family)
MNRQFNKLVDEILELRWKARPVEATFSGIHRYDRKLDRTDARSRKHYLERAKQYLKKLDAFSPSRRIRSKGANLSVEEQMDWRMLRDALRVEIAEELAVRWHERSAQIYPYYALMGCYIFIMRDFAPLGTRMKSLLARLKQVPRFLREGQENLKRGRNIPAIWTQIGIETTVGGKQFFEKMIPAFARKAPGLREQILAANRKALAAFDDYEKFLKTRLMSKSKGRFAVGKKHFDFLLSVHHQLPYTSGDLTSIGKRIIKETQAEMKSVAAKIDRRRNWTKIVEELKETHPTKKGLLGFYKREMTRARDFVKKRDLVTIPKGESLSVVETPSFQRHTTPYGAYLPPAPFERKQKGLFWVTPVNEKLPAKQQEEQLQGHNSYVAVITALHEAYPGHHLQLVHSNRIKSKVRRELATSLFAEGWALYCEELMYEQGFYTKPQTRLLQLKDQLWRGCRVVIDAGPCIPER